MTNVRKKVIVVEDDQEICNLLKIHLSDLDCEVDTYHNGTEGFNAIVANEAHLIILDLMLPGMDGLEICQKTRAREIHTPVLMLTARSEEIDRVLGLEMGADDYMVKPFSVREFIARVKAIFRRVKLNKESLQQQRQKVLDFEGLSIDIEHHKVLRDGQRVDLSPKEFELLVLMASNPGKNYDRSRLLNLIWGYDFEGYEHTVNSHINRLRAKIEPDMNTPMYILTTWGVGYKFNEEIPDHD